MLLATDFMCEALARATSIPGLTWQSSLGDLDVVRDGLGARISSAFTFTGSRPVASPQSLTVDAWTTVSGDSPMTLKVTIAVPLTDGGFLVKGELAYPHEVSAPMVDPAFTSEQRANTLDMVLRVFRAAGECCARPGGSQMEPSRVPQTDALEIFSVFALSRMYRWGMAELEEGSAALSLLQRDAARQLTFDVATVPAEVNKWFGSRLVLRRAHDVYLDAVLYDIELSARHRLIGVMADPPMKDPVSQLSLLRQAMAAHPALWASARITARPEFAFALGVDLEPGQVPPDAIEPLLAGFPDLLPRPSRPAALPPVWEWLNVSPLL